MRTTRWRTGVLIGAGCVAAAGVAFFPRVLAFAELAARALRYLWWLVLLAALGVWLAVFSRRGDR
jgi:hypothetical protein